MVKGRFIALLLTAIFHAATWSTAQAAGRLDVVRVEVADRQIAPGGGQLVQVVLGNTGQDAMRVGLKVDLLDNRNRRLGSPQTRLVTIPAKDESRTLFRFPVPERSGRYAVRFEAYRPDFKTRLIRGNPVFITPFQVGRGPTSTATGETIRSGMLIPGFSPPTGLAFELPDLLWENMTVNPPDLLLGETLKIKADLRNVGGDIARGVHVNIGYFNTRTPKRLIPISKNVVQILAPGEKIEMEFEAILPDTTLLGSYRIAIQADIGDRIEESNEENNRALSGEFRLSRIKLIFPQPDFSFDETGLFLFRWDSLLYNEFKVQVGTDPAFRDAANFFDLPQGEKWTRDKEIVPLEGELPAMAMGLMEKTKSNTLYWRVTGRAQDLQPGFSQVFPFTIRPEKQAPAEQPPPAAPVAPPSGQAPTTAPPRPPTGGAPGGLAPQAPAREGTQGGG